MYQLRVTVRDQGTRFTIVADYSMTDPDGVSTSLAQSEPLTFVRTEQTSLDPLQAILEVLTDAARCMADSGFQPRYCRSLF